MRYFKITMENGYCTCKQEEYLIFDSQEQADEYIAETLHDYGESYEHCADGCSFSEGWESDEARDFYYENLCGSAEEISEEEYNKDI